MRPRLLGTLALALLVPPGLAAQAVPDSLARASGPTPAPVADSIAQLAQSAADAAAANAVSLNFVWVLVAGFLVMFMQAGFAMVETGFTRAKNAGHTVTMNFMVYGIAMMAYWAVGFAIQAGGVSALGGLGAWDAAHLFTIKLGEHEWGIFGTKGFFLTGVAYSAPVFAYFLFQMVFMDTAATIPTGALAERWKFSAFAVFSLFVGALIYPLYANWTWGGGWLSQLGSHLGLGHGHVDFAGSSVVHMTGGVMALVAAKLLGPRRGKYNPDGSVNAIPGHNIPMAMIGTFILCFGWFGFNAGSTLMGTDTRIGVIATNTMLAGAAGSVAAMLYMWTRYGKPDPSMLANGALAGLVAITAPCAFVTAPSAVLIGAVAGVLVCWSVFFFERKAKIDDPVGAISVHGVNGLWGILALGLFADGSYGAGWNGVEGNVTGLFYGDPGQFAAQVIGGLTNVVTVGSLTLLAYGITAVFTRGHRVSVGAESQGLDLPEMGALAYPDTADLSSAVVLAETRAGAERRAA